MTVDLEKPLRPARNGRTVFLWNRWRWITLTEEELIIFETLVHEASKCEEWKP